MSPAGRGYAIMTTRPHQVLLLFLSFALGACASTEIEESWVDPSLQALPPFRKVFVAYLGADASVQRVAEDALAAQLHAPEVACCYALFPDARGLDPAGVKARLREQGFDAAVVMRLAAVEKEVSWSSPSSYPTYSSSFSSFGSCWSYAHDPGTLRTDEIVHVETNLYSLIEDKLLYAARSETFNPGSTAELVEGIAASVADDLDEKGFPRSSRAQPR